MSGPGLLHMEARVRPPFTDAELRGMGADELFDQFLHEDRWVVFGANYRGEIVTRDTTARRDQLMEEIRSRLRLGVRV